MLLSTLYDNATLAQYEELLNTLSQLMLLHALRPMDVLLFVQAAMNLKGQHSMAVFAFDEVHGCLAGNHDHLQLRESSSKQPWCTQCLACWLTRFPCVFHPTVLLRSMPYIPRPAAAHRGCSVSCQNSCTLWLRLGEQSWR